MAISYSRKAKATTESLICFIGSGIPSALPVKITAETKKALKARPAKWQKFLHVSAKDKPLLRIPEAPAKEDRCEYFRQMGAEIWSFLKSNNQHSVFFANGEEDDLLALMEGLVLKDYRFEAYKGEPAAFCVKRISVPTSACSKSAIEELRGKLRGITLARDLVNEPANILTATEFANRIKKAGKEAGFKVEVLGKAKIRALKMGGILAVNQGSTKEPTFSVLEYKPVKAKNKKPIVLVGKGIVYDTGGLSLKPTANSMDMMKCDMGGGAAVVGAIYAAAVAKLPVHVIGLIPATDNQPGPDAYGPGDVITMMDGTRVEVMNTDAEGRLVMADALAYAKRYNPELGIDIATLTGSAMRTLGYYGATLSATAKDETVNQLKKASFDAWERVVELPLWEDYETDLQSDIADVRNIGTSPLAGAIHAGKFLQRFTHYPWMHIDIAGPAFLPAGRGYLPKGGTGFGVNLLFHFLKNYK